MDHCCVTCILAGVLGVLLLIGQLYPASTKNLDRRLEELKKEKP